MQLSSEQELKDVLRLHELLNKHASNTDHGQATVVEFLGLDHPELFLVLRLEAEGVETEVPRAVVLLEATLTGNGAWLGEGLGDGVGFDYTHAKEGDRPKLSSNGDAKDDKNTWFSYYFRGWGIHHT